MARPSPGGARCASTSVRRRASARRSPCSTRGTGGASGGPTSSSGSSRRTGGTARPSRSGTSRSCPDARSSTAGAPSTRWTSTPSCAAAPSSCWSTSSPTPTSRGRATRSAGRTSRSSWRPGIDVISTVNVQHLESLNDVVERITGIHQRETVPDHAVRAADQIELVDMAPEALRRRLAHGNVYGPEKIDAALGNYFRAGNLSALRELALLWVADRVDDALSDYRDRHGISRPWETRERVVVALSGAPGADHLVRRAARIAQRAKGELIGVHVLADTGLSAGATRPTAEAMAAQRRLLEELGGEYRRVTSNDVAAHARRAGAGRERHPDRARRQRPVPLAGGVRRLGDQPRHPAVRADRRARDLPAGRRRRRHAERRLPVVKPVLTPLSPRRQLWGWVHRRGRPPADHAGVRPHPRHVRADQRAAALPRAGDGRGPRRRARCRPSSPCSAGSCSPTGSSRRRTTGSTSPTARTCSPSSCTSSPPASSPCSSTGSGAAACGAARAQAEAEALAALAGAMARPGSRRRDARPAARDVRRARRHAVPARRRRGGTSLVSSGADPPVDPAHADVSREVGRDVDPGPRRRRAVARRPARARRVRRPGRRGRRARAAAGRGGQGRRAGGGEHAAGLAAAGRVPRPAHAAGVDQGVDLQPAPARHRLGAGGRRRVPAHDRGGDRPADRPRRQPARHEPPAGVGADRRAAADRRRGDGVRRRRQPRRRRARRSRSTCPSRCRTVSADAALLERALANLVGNAVRHGSELAAPRITAGEVVHDGRAARRHPGDRPRSGHPPDRPRARVPAVPARSSTTGPTATASGSAWPSPAASSRRWAASWPSTTRPAAASRWSSGCPSCGTERRP